MQAQSQILRPTIQQELLLLLLLLRVGHAMRCGDSACTIGTWRAARHFTACCTRLGGNAWCKQAWRFTLLAKPERHGGARPEGV